MATCDGTRPSDMCLSEDSHQSEPAPKSAQVRGGSLGEARYLVVPPLSTAHVTQELRTDMLAAYSAA